MNISEVIEEELLENAKKPKIKNEILNDDVKEELIDYCNIEVTDPHDKYYNHWIKKEWTDV